MLLSRTRLAETSSWVESGFEAQRTTSAPPSRRQIARFAVSAVTCRQAEMRIPLSGWFLINSFRIICSTFMDWLAHSMRFLPSSASSKLLISEFTCAAVDIRLLWRLHAKNLSLLTKNSRYQCSVRIHESNLDSAYSKTLRGMALSAHVERAPSPTSA